MEGLFQKIETPLISVSKDWFADGYIFVQLADQRIIGHPIVWNPRLA